MIFDLYTMDFFKTSPLDLLRKFNGDPVSFWDYNGKTCYAKVVSVYDGDTCTIVMPLSDKDHTFYKFTVRLNGIDTPEKRSKDEMEKKASIKVKELVEKFILGKIVKIQCGEFDKYGRILGDIYVMDHFTKREFSVNQFLIDNRLCKSYAGGTKEAFQHSDYSSILNSKVYDTAPETEDF